jgi:hypothetical protein
MSTFSFRLPPHLAAKLRRLAQRTGRPAAHFVRFLIATTSPDCLPRAWFDGSQAERLAATHRSRPRRTTPQETSTDGAERTEPEK